MENGFNKDIKHGVIVLSDIKEVNEYGMLEYFRDKNKDDDYYRFGLFHEKKVKTPEEIKEIIEKKNKIKNESIELYYKINKEKYKEIESKFSQLQLKVKFSDDPKFLREGKLYTFKDGIFSVYDNKFFKKTNEIQLLPDIYLISAIQLNNNDLVLALKIKEGKGWKYKFELWIYRLKNEEYSLFQKIDENMKGYSLQYSRSGCLVEPKNYNIISFKEISGNRFICINNYGFKIYSLDDKNEYSLILLDEHSENIENIYEINNNKFIFCTIKTHGASMGGPGYNEIFIDMIELNDITEEEKNKKLKEQYEKDGDNIIKSLKLSSSIKKIIEYETYRGYIRNHELSDFVIIKNKYFIIMIDNNILVIDLKNGSILKRYEILIEGKDNLFIPRYITIKKWNYKEDNVFLLFIDGNIITFELNDDEDEDTKINLKIINQFYCSNIKGSDLKKLSKNENKFYDFDYSSKSITLY